MSEPAEGSIADYKQRIANMVRCYDEISESLRLALEQRDMWLKIANERSAEICRLRGQIDKFDQLVNEHVARTLETANELSARCLEVAQLKLRCESLEAANAKLRAQMERNKYA